MFKITQIIQNIKTDLAALTWQSTSGGGSTQFVTVKTFEDYSNTAGSPFAVILDTAAPSETPSNKYVFFEHTIEIQICSNYAVNNPENIPAAQEEAMLRVREAWDAIRVHIVKDSTMDTYLGTMKGWTRQFEFSDSNLLELNLFRRIVRMRIKESTLRY